MPRGFRLHRRPAQHPRGGAEALRAVRRRLLAGARPQRRISVRFPHVDGRGRLAGHRHARGGRRLGSGDHRGCGDDAGGGRKRRRHDRGIQRPRPGVRSGTGDPVRHGRTAGANDPADHFRRGEDVFCRDRTQHRARHHQPQDQGREGSGRLQGQRREDLDHQRPCRRPHAADRADHAAGRSQEEDRGADAVLLQARPHRHRAPADPENGAPCGGLEHAVHQRPVHPRRGPHRRGRSGLSYPAQGAQSGARAARRGSHRPWPYRHPEGIQIRAGTHRLRAPDRPEPGHPAPARQGLDAGRGRQPDGVQGRHPVRSEESIAVSRPTAPNTSPQKPATRPARPQ